MTFLSIINTISELDDSLFYKAGSEAGDVLAKPGISAHLIRQASTLEAPLSHLIAQ